METKLQSQQMQYPRFIQNKPCGIDKLDGAAERSSVVAEWLNQA